MTRPLLTTLVAVIALLTVPVGAAEPEHGKAPSHGDSSSAHAAPHAVPHGDHADDHDAGPKVAPDVNPTWVGVVLILIAAMFIMAAVIGPIARMHAPPAEMPVTHSHDEPPGASHHHGHSGTINPEPDHGHASDHGHH